MDNRSASELGRRHAAFIVSLFIMSIGVALTLRSGLGSSAVSLWPYVWSQAHGIHIDLLGLSFTIPSWTVGQYTICMNTLLVALQILMLRHGFQKIQLLQMATGLLFGIFIDVAMMLTSWFVWDTTAMGYSMRMVQLVVAGAIVGFGIACEVRCNVLLLPGEGFCVALAKVTGQEFSKAKIYNDTAMVAVGVLFSLLFFHEWRWDIAGVATLVSMVWVGATVRFFSPHLGWLDNILNHRRHVTVSQPPSR